MGMDSQPEGILVGDGPSGPVSLVLRRANRHGLVTGATGTGKTVTLQRIAEGFAKAGVPVFAADVKGDLAGIAAAREPGATAAPAVVWDLFGRVGHPVRTTITEFGPFLFAELLQLNPTQAGVLEIVFRFADDNGLLLIDLKDLRSLLAHVSENAKTVSATYGQVAPASVAAIQRGLLSLESQSAGQFFGEPALEIGDLMRTDLQGRGYVNILAADQLIQRPKLYASFLLWLLSELFESLPEVGDLPKPKLVFFFDEAHLLFDDAPKVLVEKVEQVVRLIRSKGVGVYFVTQNPLDVPVEILGQLGNRVQHALRAFTPRDQKAVRVAAETFRQNPAFDTAKAITELGVGEALISMLDEKGVPGMVDRVKVRLPESRLGPLADAERRQLMAVSPVAGRYDRAVDRESAYERLTQKVQAAPPAPAQARSRIPESAPARTEPRGRQREGVGEAMAKSVARAIGSQVGRQIVRGVLGALLKGR